MKPIDFSRQTYEELKGLIEEKRAEAHRAWLDHGPGTTREVAAKANFSILTFRPRSTELYQLGLLELTTKAGHSGTYRARTLAEWEQFIQYQRTHISTQLQMGLTTQIGNALPI